MRKPLPRESSRFAINHMQFDLVENELRVTVDCADEARSYLCAWNPERAEAFALIKHWGDDNEDSTADINPNLAADLERFLDSSDVVAEAFHELGWEAVVGSRKCAGGAR